MVYIFLVSIVHERGFTYCHQIEILPHKPEKIVTLLALVLEVRRNSLFSKAPYLMVSAVCAPRAKPGLEKTVSAAR